MKESALFNQKGGKTTLIERKGCSNIKWTIEATNKENNSLGSTLHKEPSTKRNLWKWE